MFPEEGKDYAALFIAILGAYHYPFEVWHFPELTHWDATVGYPKGHYQSALQKARNPHAYLSSHDS